MIFNCPKGPSVSSFTFLWVPVYPNQHCYGSQCIQINIFMGPSVSKLKFLWVPVYPNYHFYGSQCIQIKFFLGPNVSKLSFLWIPVYPNYHFYGSQCIQINNPGKRKNFVMYFNFYIYKPCHRSTHFSIEFLPLRECSQKQNGVQADVGSRIGTNFTASHVVSKEKIVKNVSYAYKQLCEFAQTLCSEV